MIRHMAKHQRDFFIKAALFGERYNLLDETLILSNKLLNEENITEKTRAVTQEDALAIHSVLVEDMTISGGQNEIDVI